MSSSPDINPLADPDIAYACSGSDDSDGDDVSIPVSAAAEIAVDYFLKKLSTKETSLRYNDAMGCLAISRLNIFQIVYFLLLNMTRY